MACGSKDYYFMAPFPCGSDYRERSSQSRVRGVRNFQKQKISYSAAQAPLTAAGRSQGGTEIRERGQMQRRRSRLSAGLYYWPKNGQQGAGAAAPDPAGGSAPATPETNFRLTPRGLLMEAVTVKERWSTVGLASTAPLQSQ